MCLSGNPFLGTAHSPACRTAPTCFAAQTAAWASADEPSAAPVRLTVTSVAMLPAAFLLGHWHLDRDAHCALTEGPNPIRCNFGKVKLRHQTGSLHPLAIRAASHTLICCACKHGRGGYWVHCGHGTTPNQSQRPRTIKDQRRAQSPGAQHADKRCRMPMACGRKAAPALASRRAAPHPAMPVVAHVSSRKNSRSEHS